MSLLVAIALATVTVTNDAFAGAVNIQGQTEPPGINPLAVEVEALGALVCGSMVGYGTAWSTYHMLHDLAGFRGDWGSWFALFAALGSGYGIGVPLGSAAGTSLVGKVTNQPGCFWRSCNGACLGAASALGIAAILWKTTDDTKWPGVVLAVGPPAGAVIGYNLRGSKGGQATGKSSSKAPGGSPLGLSLLIAEATVRQDRFSKNPQPTWRLTFARLNF